MGLQHPESSTAQACPKIILRLLLHNTVLQQQEMYNPPASKHMTASKHITDCVTAPTGSSDVVGIPLSATWPRLRFAFAGCLQSAFCHSGSDTLSREEGVNSEADPSIAMQPDPRAVLILQLLLAGLQGPVPSLTHLLMGFDVTRGPEGDLLEVTSGVYRLLQVLNVSYLGFPEMSPEVLKVSDLRFKRCL